MLVIKTTPYWGGGGGGGGGWLDPFFQYVLCVVLLGSFNIILSLRYENSTMYSAMEYR